MRLRYIAGRAVVALGAMTSVGLPLGAPATHSAAATSVPPPLLSGFPDASNTGVPAGTTLTDYTGPCTITDDHTVIASKNVTCQLEIRARGVVIERSRVNGHIYSAEGSDSSFTVVDSEVDGQGSTWSTVGATNFSITRSEIFNAGQTLVYCYGNCVIRDSWLHGLTTPGAESHLGAFLANDDGGDPTVGDDPAARTDVTLIHNTIHCDAAEVGDGGCSGNVNLFGDFGPITNVMVDNNLFRASTGMSFCVYGGDGGSKPFPVSSHVVFVNNVFERGTNGKCGFYGPVGGFNIDRPGNRWENNVWGDGAAVPPAN
jgi:hypothetical protein